MKGIIYEYYNASTNMYYIGQTSIRHYKFLKRKLYNISKGGNLSLQGITPTPKMLKALEEGRINNNKLKANKFSKEEIKERHRVQSKMYTINNPEKYKEIYTKSNAKRKEVKRGSMSLFYCFIKFSR